MSRLDHAPPHTHALARTADSGGAARVAVLLCALVWLVSPRTAGAEPTLRVRAQVSIELNIVTNNAGTHISGLLQDDLGARLANRMVTLAFDGGAAPGQSRTRSLRTDSRGEFSLRAPCTSCSVSAEFGGDAFYERTTATRPVVTDRPALSLEIVEPGQLGVSLDEPILEVVVRASSVAPVDGLSVQLSNELAHNVARGETGADGVMRLKLDPRTLGPHGLGELVASAPASDRHSAGKTSRAVLRTLQTRTELRAEFMPKTRSLHIAAQLSSASGPIPRRALGIFVDREHFTTLLTADSGAAAGDVSVSDELFASGTHRIHASFQSDIPGLLSSQSSSVNVEIVPPPRPSVFWLLLPVIGSLVFLFWSTRRAPIRVVRTQSSQSAGPEVRLGVEARGRSLPQTTISGRVEDVDSGQPVRAAIEVVANDALIAVVDTGPDGRFESAALPSGDCQVRMLAPGYVQMSFTLTIPHHGSGTDLQIAARGLRTLALEAYARFVEHYLPDARTRGKTVRETLSAAVGCGKATPTVSLLAERAEKIAYARAVPFEGDLHELQRAAADALREPGEPAPTRETLT